MPTPAFRVDVNGGSLSDEIQKRLLSLRVHDEAGFANDRMELAVDNRPPFISLPAKGDVFTVFMGFVGKLRKMGTYEFDEAAAGGPPHTVTITAHAKDTGSSFKGSQQTSWHGKSLGDIVGEIGKRQGMGTQIAGALSGIKIPHIDQTTQSDMGFLTDLAKKNNAVMKIIDQKIFFAPRDQTKTESGQDIASGAIAFTEDTRYNYISQGRGNYTGVKARYYDKEKGKEMFSGAGDVNKVVHTLQEIFSNKEEAQKAADSHNSTMERARETLELVLPGNPDLMAETPFSISGFPGFIPTTWTTDKAEHFMTTKGAYTTTIVGVTPNSSSGGSGGGGGGGSDGGGSGGGGGGSGGGSGGSGSDGGGSGGGGGDQEEKSDNKEDSNDGYEITESIDEGEGGGKDSDFI